MGATIIQPKFGCIFWEQQHFDYMPAMGATFNYILAIGAAFNYIFEIGAAAEYVSTFIYVKFSPQV